MSAKLLLDNAVITLVFTCLIQFLTISFKTIRTKLAGVGPSLSSTTHDLKRAPGRALTGVRIPLLNDDLLATIVLIFISIVGRLPTALVVHPFGFSALTIQICRCTTSRHLTRTSTPTLTVVIIKLLPIL